MYHRQTKPKLPFRIRTINPIKLVSQLMLVSMVTHTAQVIVWAVCTLPSHSINWLHATTIAHTTIMFYAWKKIHQALF